MKYYSQFGQDRYLYENYYHGKTRGTFIDIGAHDGISGSNTMFFEAMGWTGICFEPIKEVFDQLTLNRRSDLRQLALSDKAGEAYFKRIKGHSEMLSGLVDQYSPQHQERIAREFSEHVQEEEMIKVRTSTFNTEVKPGQYDILSIDVEGAEGTILRSLDWKQYQIDHLVVEFNDGADNELQSYLERQGYVAVVRKGVDIIFKRNI